MNVVEGAATVEVEVVVEENGGLKQVAAICDDSAETLFSQGLFPVSGEILRNIAVRMANGFPVELRMSRTFHSP